MQSLEARLKEAATKNIALIKENELLRDKVVQLQKEVSLHYWSELTLKIILLRTRNYVAVLAILLVVQ